MIKDIERIKTKTRTLQRRVTALEEQNDLLRKALAVVFHKTGIDKQYCIDNLAAITQLYQDIATL